MLNLNLFPSPLIVKSTVDDRVKMSSERAASSNATPANVQERPPTAQPGKKLRFGDYKLNIEVRGTANHKQDISYIPLGGTISAEGTEHNYKAGKKSGKNLLGTAHIPHNVRITVGQSPFTIDSKDLKPEHLFMVRDTALKELETKDSLIFSTGSCTIDALEFFLSLTMPKEKMEGKKIILFGAMKPANYKEPDGPTNFSNALRLAKRTDVSGIMTIMNATGEVFSSPYFAKRHTEAVTAFKAVNGPLAAQIRRMPVRNKHVVSIKNEQIAPPRTFDIGDVKELAYVPVIQSQGTVDPKMIIDNIEYQIAQGARAIVFAGTGMGSIHEDIEKAMHDIIERTGIPIIRATKAGDGEVKHNGGVFNDDLHGTIAAGKLMPDMAVLLAQVAMAELQHQGKEIDNDELRALLRTEFDRYQTPKKAEEEAPAV